MLRSLVPFSALTVSLFAGATASAEEGDLQALHELLRAARAGGGVGAMNEPAC